MTRNFLFLAALALSSMSCASYEPTSATVPVATEIKNQLLQDDILLQARAIGTVEDQEAYLDADLNGAGVTALQVKLTNNGPSPYLIRTSDLTLEITEDLIVEPIPSTLAAQKVGEDGNVVGAAIAFGLIGFLAASSAEEEARAARSVDYENKALKAGVLAAGESRQGVLFYAPSPGTAPFDKAVLRARFVTSTGEDVVSMRLPLIGFAYSGRPKGEVTAAKPVNADQNTSDGPSANRTFLDLPQESPRRGHTEVAHYIDGHNEALRRQVYNYNKEHRVELHSGNTGFYKDYALHDMEVLDLGGDEVVAKAVYSIRRTWSPQIRSTVFLLRWRGDDLVIVDHQKLS